MKHLSKPIFSFILILFFVNNMKAQESAFYIRSLRSIHLKNDYAAFQKINFNKVDLVYNKIINFDDQTIQVIESAIYELNGFVNINPGVVGKSAKDKIDVEVLLLANFQKPNQKTIASSTYSFTFGNLDVSHSFVFQNLHSNLLADDVIEIRVVILPTSTIDMNKSSKYHQINKPTGLEQIAGLRIKKKTLN